MVSYEKQIINHADESLNPLPSKQKELWDWILWSSSMTNKGCL
jgi:hypothetical protein